MKKNLRIVSAAAAALLAVAPVAATSFVAPASTVSAAVQKPTADYTVPGTITLDRGTNTQFSVKLSQDQEEGIAAAFSKKVSDIKSIVVSSATAPDTTGSFYQVLTVTFKDNSTKTVLTTAKFASQQGTPYFYDRKTNMVVNNGDTVNLDNIANGFSSQDLLDAINKKYGWKTSDQSNDSITMTTTASDVESQLIAQGLKRASNGNFDYPANGFNLKLTAKSENGNTASVTVRINKNVNLNAPVFLVRDKAESTGTVYFNNNLVYNGEAFVAGPQIVYNYDDVLKKGGKNYNFGGLVVPYVQSAYTGKDGKSEFATTADKLLNSAKQQVINDKSTSIDDSKVNTKVAGMYPVTITATNPAGFTSKFVVYAIVIGRLHKNT